MEDYKREVGRRLRAVRHMQGLTLADVEERSEGDWKAVVVGSYERGDRGISVARLSTLAAFYGVPVSHLLPTEASVDHLGSDGATIDLAALVTMSERFPTLARFVERIQQERGDYNGRVLTLRSEDVRAVAAATGVEVTDLVTELRRAGMLVSRGGEATGTEPGHDEDVTPAPRPARAL